MRILSCLFAIMLVPFGLLAQSNPQEGIGSKMNTPKALIESRAIARVLIFHVPDSTMTRVVLTPQALLSMAGSGFEITTDIRERLEPVFAGMSFQHEKHVPDLRWGILFYDVNNREIGSVFVDKFGQYGYVNREPRSFQSDHQGSNLAKELHKLTGDQREPVAPGCASGWRNPGRAGCRGRVSLTPTDEK